MNDDRLDPRITNLLRQEQAPPRFPAGEVKERIAATLRRRKEPTRRTDRWFGHPALRPAMAAAAAVLIFVGGAEYGRRTAAVPNAARAAVRVVDLSAPISIQSAGSRYVARLAEFAEHAPTLSVEEREEARQVALAILYAATVELLQDQEDELLNAVVRLIHSKRQSLRNPEHPDAVWF